MTEFISWKTQPIFISSTFTDMMAERDALRDFVFPELEEKLREQRIRLEAIDLRWGVETSDIKEQQEKELLVLRVCLDEIDRSMPFFVGIIGDRYGWVPPKERLIAVENEKGFVSSIQDKSVTALEIEYGVLADEDQLKRSFFIFREALPYDKIPEDIRAKYADIYNSELDFNKAQKRIDNFKALIVKKIGKEKVFTYKAEWDEENNKVTGLDDFKKLVLDCLYKEIVEQTDEVKDLRPKSWQEEEKLFLDEFVEDRSVCFSGRKDIIQTLMDFAFAKEKDEHWGLCLTGDSGCGKSALFAKMYRELQKENDIVVLAHSAGISLRSGSLNNMLTLWIEKLAAELNIDPGSILKEGQQFNQLKDIFHRLLAQLSQSKRIVVLVDALDESENTAHAKHINWLADEMPENVRFIFTAGIFINAMIQLRQKLFMEEARLIRL